MAVKRRLSSPRVAIIGFTAEEAEELAALVETPLISYNAFQLERPFDEIDLAVVSGDATSIPPGVPVLCRLDTTTDDLKYGDVAKVDQFGQRGLPGFGWVNAQSTDAKELIPKTTGPLADLIDALIDTFPVGSDYVVMRAGGDAEVTDVFVINPRKEILSFEYERTNEAPAWALPSHVGDLRPWLRKFLQRVADWDEDRVPNPPPDWDPWLTAEEQGLADDYQQLLDDYKAVASEYNDRFNTLAAKQDAAKEQAATGLGRLLTEDGEELKNAVADALDRLGFEVTDADAELEEGEGKREDLRVPGNGGEILVEVKGYTKGAKSNDLITAKEYVTTYLERTGNRPSGQWHIVNAYRGRSPELRGRLFSGQDDMVASFGGLVIDTRDLFLLVGDVESGAIGDDEARKLLLEDEPGFFERPS